MDAVATGEVTNQTASPVSLVVTVDENAGQFWDASGSLSIPVVMPGQSTSWTIAVPYLSNATNNPICSVTSVQADSAY